MSTSLETSFRNIHPDIPWLTSSSPTYAAHRSIYRLNHTASPLAIVRPPTATAVASIVCWATQHSVPLTVRAGGHDLYGRCVIDGAICVDLRGVDVVEVAGDRRTVRIGGGALTQRVVEVLGRDGLAIPSPSVPSVGWFGWAGLGGYSYSVNLFGFGVDQIVSAEVVDARGEVVKANGGEELLKGVKGMGGRLGVVVSVEARVYELKSMLGGMLVFDPSAKGVGPTFTDLVNGLQQLRAEGKIPTTLSTLPMVMTHPENGPFVAVVVSWASSDHAAGHRHIEPLTTLGQIVANTITERTPAQFVEFMGSFIPPGTWGYEQSVLFRRATPKILHVINDACATMGQIPGVGSVIYTVDKECPSVANAELAEQSCFNPEERQPHAMMEIWGSGPDRSKMEEAVAWGDRLRKALVETGDLMIGSYVSVTQPKDVTGEVVYGEKWGIVKGLREKFDPEGVFRLAAPVLD